MPSVPKQKTPKMPGPGEDAEVKKGGRGRCPGKTRNKVPHIPLSVANHENIKTSLKETAIKGYQLSTERYETTNPHVPFDDKARWAILGAFPYLKCLLRISDSFLATELAPMLEPIAHLLNLNRGSIRLRAKRSALVFGCPLFSPKYDHAVAQINLITNSPSFREPQLVLIYCLCFCLRYEH